MNDYIYIAKGKVEYPGDYLQSDVYYQEGFLKKPSLTKLVFVMSWS